MSLISYPQLRQQNYIATVVNNVFSLRFNNAYNTPVLKGSSVQVIICFSSQSVGVSSVVDNLNVGNVYTQIVNDNFGPAGNSVFYYNCDNFNITATPIITVTLNSSVNNCAVIIQEISNTSGYFTPPSGIVGGQVVAPGTSINAVTKSTFNGSSLSQSTALLFSICVDRTGFSGNLVMGSSYTPPPPVLSPNQTINSINPFTSCGSSVCLESTLITNGMSINTTYTDSVNGGTDTYVIFQTYYGSLNPAIINTDSCL